jgi:hypothetical protein
MTSVLDYEADAGVSREVHSKLYLRNVGGIHGVRWISALGAALCVKKGRRLACQTNLVRAHDFNGVIASVRMSVCACSMR